jgi:hypothetical protein
MTDGNENTTWENQCQPTKQQFGKPQHTGKCFACQTVAFYPSHHINGHNKDHFEKNSSSIIFDK